LADLLDDLRQQGAAALGFLGQSADLRHHRARPLDEFVGRGYGEAADRGSIHANASLASPSFNGAAIWLELYSPANRPGNQIGRSRGFAA
jgi:hypothetical protein